jgi:hypothetical protein
MGKCQQQIPTAQQEFREGLAADKHVNGRGPFSPPKSCCRVFPHQVDGAGAMHVKHNISPHPKREKLNELLTTILMQAY